MPIGELLLRIGRYIALAGLYLCPGVPVERLTLPLAGRLRPASRSDTAHRRGRGRDVAAAGPDLTSPGGVAPHPAPPGAAGSGRSVPRVSAPPVLPDGAPRSLPYPPPPVAPPSVPYPPSLLPSPPPVAGPPAEPYRLPPPAPPAPPSVPFAAIPATPDWHPERVTGAPPSPVERDLWARLGVPI